MYCIVLKLMCQYLMQKFGIVVVPDVSLSVLDGLYLTKTLIGMHKTCTSESSIHTYDFSPHNNFSPHHTSPHMILRPHMINLLQYFTPTYPVFAELRGKVKGRLALL